MGEYTNYPRVRVVGEGGLGSEVKATTKKTISGSNTLATLLTPTSGKKVRVIAAIVTSSSATGAEFEIYFGTGANMDITPANVIFNAYLEADVNTGHATITFPEGGGPVGDADAVVSMRTSGDIADAGRFTIFYREE